MSHDASFAYHDYSVADPPHQPMYLDAMVRYLRSDPSIKRVLDCGCGDGNFTKSLADAGFSMFGIDMSEGGVAKATVAYPEIKFAHASVYDDLRRSFAGVSQFDAVVSIEVIEHLYSPRTFVRRAREVLRPGGLVIVTTPFWGYWKNLLLAISGRTDRALTALWDGGHIKHWSFATLTRLFAEQGFQCVGFQGAGRPIPYLWSGMMVAFRSPTTEEREDAGARIRLEPAYRKIEGLARG